MLLKIPLKPVFSLEQALPLTTKKVIVAYSISKFFCLRQLFVPLLLSLSAATRAAGTSVVFAPTDTTIHYREPAPVQYTQDYYKILEVEYDASDEKIRLNYRRLALKWHPDKHKCNDAATAKFQEINEAYSVLSDPDKRLDYDLNGNYEINNFTLPEYLARFKGMILTCNGLGISQDSVWSEQLTEINKLMDK